MPHDIKMDFGKVSEYRFPKRVSLHENISDKPITVVWEVKVTAPETYELVAKTCAKEVLPGQVLDTNESPLKKHEVSEMINAGILRSVNKNEYTPSFLVSAFGHRGRPNFINLNPDRETVSVLVHSEGKDVAAHVPYEHYLTILGTDAVTLDLRKKVRAGILARP